MGYYGVKQLGIRTLGFSLPEFNTFQIISDEFEIWEKICGSTGDFAIYKSSNFVNAFNLVSIMENKNKMQISKTY